MLIKYNPIELAATIDQLTKIEVLVKSSFVDFETGAKMRPNKKVVESWKDSLEVSLTMLKNHCEALALVETANTIKDIIQTIPSEDIRTLQSNINLIVLSIERQFNQRIFFTLSVENANLYTSDFPFGAEVGFTFPTVNREVNEAGKCYAVGRYTACVFHLMRVLEVGLRELASYVGVADFGLENWKNIIDQIEKKIRDMESLPKTIEKDIETQFLGEAAKEFSHFKMTMEKSCFPHKS